MSSMFMKRLYIYSLLNNSLEYVFVNKMLHCIHLMSEYKTKRV